MVTKQIEHKGHRYNVRPDTLDEWVVGEVWTPREYASAMNLGPDDVVLDAGANIGAFSVLAASCGARVVGFEPDPENFAIAESNVTLNGYDDRVQLHNVGLWTHDDEMRLYINPRNRGMATLRRVRGRSSVVVPLRSFADVLRKVDPTKIKMDVEGAEYPIFMAVEDWHNVELIRMEWHIAVLKDQRWLKLQRMIDRLQSFGFVLTGEDGFPRPGRGRGGWVRDTMITVRRA